MRSLLRLILWTAIIAASVIGLARATAIRWWRVPLDDPWLGVSLTPTLNPGDWVILWRLTRPSQGDLVVCPEPKAPERIVVARVFGTANDDVDSAGGALRLNGRIPPSEGKCSGFQIVHPKTGAFVDQYCGVENLEGHLHLRGDLADPSAANTTSKTTAVEPGRFFLASDNRRFFFDSRDYGTVEAASCKETVVFRLWSKDGYFNPTGRFEYIH